MLDIPMFYNGGGLLLVLLLVIAGVLMHAHHRLKGQTPVNPIFALAIGVLIVVMLLVAIAGWVVSR